MYKMTNIYTKKACMDIHGHPYVHNTWSEKSNGPNSTSNSIDELINSGEISLSKNIEYTSMAAKHLGYESTDSADEADLNKYQM